MCYPLGTMFQSTAKLSAKMLSPKALVLVLTLVASALVMVRGEEETTEKTGFAEAAKEKWAQGVEAAKKGISQAEEAFNNAKDKGRQNKHEIVKSAAEEKSAEELGEELGELAALEPILGIVMGIKAKVSGIVQGLIGMFVGLLGGRSQIGPMASNFSEGFKEKFNEGVQKAQDVFKQAKDSIASHVSPFVNKVRKGMLDGVRNLRDKLHKKDKEGGEKEGGTEEATESSEKATVKAEINSGEDGA